MVAKLMLANLCIAKRVLLVPDCRLGVLAHSRDHRIGYVQHITARTDVR